MSEQNIENQRSVEPIKQNDEMEIDLMEILRKIVGIRKSLYKAAGIGLVIGIVVALSIPKQYAVKVTLSPEMGGGKGNSSLAGMAASFLGGNISASDDVDALNASLSSEIVSSTPFLIDLLDIDVPSSESNTPMTLEAYLDEQPSPWWRYVIGLPGMIIGGIKSLFEEEQNKCFTNRVKHGTIELTKEEYEKVLFLKKNIVATIDKKTAITSVSVTLQNPQVVAVVADSVVHKLQECIIGYRTFKAKEDCI